jgi:hypothetical protein
LRSAFSAGMGSDHPHQPGWPRQALASAKVRFRGGCTLARRVISSVGDVGDRVNAASGQCALLGRRWRRVRDFGVTPRKLTASDSVQRLIDDPSSHRTILTSAVCGNPGNIYLLRVLPPVTPSRPPEAAPVVAGGATGDRRSGAPAPP